MTVRARQVGTIAAALLLAFGATTVPRVLAGTNGVAYDDQYLVYEDHELVVAAPGVLANDYPSDSCVISTDTFDLRGSVGLGVGFDGHFRFTPSADFNGATSFTYVMGQNSGGCPSGAADTGQVFITVRKVNDPPGIVLTQPCTQTITVEEDAGTFTAAHCVEMVNFGPTQDENNQSFDAWLVSTTHPELFAKKPAITQVDGLFGRLTFTPAKDANGTATVSVRGRDSGGTANDGDDTSDPLKFKIVITPIDDPTTPPPPTEAPTAASTPDVTAAPATPEPTAAATTGAATPAASVAPAPTGDEGGGLPLAAILGAVLLVLVAGFLAALLVPRWQASRGP